MRIWSNDFCFSSQSLDIYCVLPFVYLLRVDFVKEKGQEKVS